MPNNVNDPAHPTQNVEKPNDKAQLNEIRQNVDELSTEVRSSVDDLKKCIAEIRSDVSEIENPFHVQKAASDESDEEKLSQAGVAGVKSINLGKEGEPVEVEEEAPPKVENTPPQVQEQPQKKPDKIVQSPKAKQIKVSEYVDWIWDLLEVGLTADNVRQLASSCELMGYLPQNNELIYSLASTAERFRSLGLTKGHLLLFLYKAAAMSKTNIDADDMETLISVAEHKLETSKQKRGTT